MTSTDSIRLVDLNGALVAIASKKSSLTPASAIWHGQATIGGTGDYFREIRSKKGKELYWLTGSP